jgi:hypothetical protein
MSSYFIVKPPVAAVSTPVYDYGSVYSNIYTALANIDADTTPMTATLALIATSLATIATNSTNISTQSTAIATALTEIETHQQTIKELAVGEGIRTIGPWDHIGFISTYKNLIEQGKITSPSTIQKSAVKESLAKLEEYRLLIKDLPKLF